MSNLTVKFIENDQIDLNTVDFLLNRPAPFARSKIFLASIKNMELLTSPEDFTKKVYKLSFNKTGFDNFLPGDTIGIFPENKESVIDALFPRLNIVGDSYEICELSSKKSLPKHLPPLSRLRNIFMENVDIEKPPKKLFLKSLIKYTGDPKEIKELEVLSSPKSAEYSQFITGAGSTLLGLLNYFPSIQPPVSLILEHLAPLQPRAFSISSSPLSEQLDITFSVTGLCTQWLESQKDKSTNIAFYFRQSNNFKMPENPTTPIVMIATGTGIAPFRSFFQHRQLEIKNKRNEFGAAYLIYGCRSPSDYLYRTEIEQCLKTGALTRTEICFSRQRKNWYVQDYIRQDGEQFWDNILLGSIFFVCGNKGMVKAVREVFIEIFGKFGQLNSEAAESAFNDLVKTNRYVVDSWV